MPPPCGPDPHNDLDSADGNDTPAAARLIEGATPAEGTYLTPAVRLLRPLGDGGMASVWIAEHLNLGVNVAVKLLNEAMLSVDVARQQFLDEGPAAARIRSPHVVHVLDRGLAPNGAPFIVMELLEGETLQQRLDRTGVLSLDEARALVSQIAGALMKAHTCGLLHCDVKPDNLFILAGEPELFVKLLDFGISKRVGDRDDSGILFGTPQYMSPEQMTSGAELDARSDVWSLGSVVYQALTARAPFDGDDFDGVAAAVKAGFFPRASSVRPDLPPELDEWFERALAASPEDRFGSMQELAVAFDAAIRPRVSTPAPTATPTPIWMPMPIDIPRRRSWALPAIAAIAVAIAGTALSAARAMSSSAEPASGTTTTRASATEQASASARQGEPTSSAPVTRVADLPSASASGAATAIVLAKTAAPARPRPIPRADPFRPRPIAKRVASAYDIESAASAQASAPAPMDPPEDPPLAQPDAP